MKLYLGVDLGTSSMKILLVNKKGEVIKKVQEYYEVHNFNEVFNEQNPLDWWNSFLIAFKKISEEIDVNQIEAISFSGQMHGLVILEENDSVIRPCILWNDGRSEKETDYLNKVIGEDFLMNEVGNISFSGFTLPKLLWVKNNESNNFKRIKKIMLPKDYIVYRLTNNFVTDYSDASGTLLLDVKNKKWSKKMAMIGNISLNILPTLHESTDIVGETNHEFNELFKISKPIKVVIGGGDNAISAVGTNCLKEGNATISLGTSGTIFVASDKFVLDKSRAIHSFAHANGKYHLLSCILSAASARSWFLEKVLNTKDYSKNEEEMTFSLKNNVLFLPYLNGERCPYNDSNLTANFFNLRYNTTSSDMSVAVIEGVCFALKDCFNKILEDGLSFNHTLITGGGSKSKLWCQMLSDVLQIPLYKQNFEEGPAFGAAIVAMVGLSEYASFDKFFAQNKIEESVFTPNKEMKEYYDRKYRQYKKLHNIALELVDIKNEK